jgi:hypothetical protein
LEGRELLSTRFIVLTVFGTVALSQQAHAANLKYELAETLATASYANNCPKFQTADVLELVIADAGLTFPDVFKSAGYAQGWALAEAQYRYDPAAWCDKVWHLLGPFPPYPLGMKHALLEKRG